MGGLGAVVCAKIVDANNMQTTTANRKNFGFVMGHLFGYCQM